MENNTNKNELIFALVDRAAAGDKAAMEELLTGVQGQVFSLSLRMLGTFPDAEDAAQDILLKVMTSLPSFRKECAFSTWVFRIAVNTLIPCKKHMFAQRPLSFDFYAADIVNAPLDGIPDMTQGVEKELLAEELKLSCTNVMLQCLDAESRCIFILGTMFGIDSRIAGEILGITADSYRQRLSRIRRKMADFLSEYCGEYGSGKCRCKNRLNYAIKSHRLDPAHLDFANASELPMEKMLECKNAMEEIDGLSAQFAFCKAYESPERTRRFIQEFLQSSVLSSVTEP